MGVLAVGALVVGSLFESRKARKASQRARKVDDRRNRLQTQRSAIEQVRKAQIGRAQVVQQGENQGVGSSSAIAGAAGSIQSQAGGNIAFAQQIFGLQQSASRLRSSAQLHSSNSQAFSSLASLSANFDFSSGGSPAPVSTATPDFVRG